MTKMVEDTLNEDAYLADVAGLHYSLSQEGTAGERTGGSGRRCSQSQTFSVSDDAV